MPAVEVASGVYLHTLEQGEGRAIVLLHGWGSSGALWHHQIGPLSERYRVIVPDLRGFGRSPRATGSLTLDLLTDDVARLLERLDLDDVLLLGWSMGGEIVMNYCARHGHRRLRSIGIADVSPRLRPASDWPIGVGVGAEIANGLERWKRLWRSDPEAVIVELTRTAFFDEAAHEEEIERLLSEGRKADPLAIELFADLFNHDFRPVLAQVDLPALLLFGRHSTSTTPAVAEYMAQALKHAQLVFFERSGHAIMIEEPEKFNQTILDFAGSV